MATRKKTASKKPNLILLGIDSLLADHMSLYGYKHLTTPHIDEFAKGGTVYEKCYSTHIPTTSGYGNMLTGLDCFGTNVVALRHKGPLGKGVKTLPEILKKDGYSTTCIGFKGNPSARGFSKHILFEGWNSDSTGRAPKAERMNDVAIPELRRLAKAKKPFFLFMRHMDPHAPYLPPHPFERMFYGGDEFDKKNKSMAPVYNFKPFCDFHMSWTPAGVTDKDYVIAQYDGAIAYLDACLQKLLIQIKGLGLEENSLVVLTSDHGETLYDHECWFDHHGLYDNTLHVPLLFRMPGTIPAGKRVKGYTTLKSVTPTILSTLGIETDIKFDGQDLLQEMNGKRRKPESEFYITECTWMRKHGWRTPEWKLIRALEPDFHFKPEVELYNLVQDPEENNNLAAKEKAVVEMLTARMEAWIAKREKETGRTNPIYTNLLWHGHDEIGGPFTSSQQAYDTMHIGNRKTAQRLQAGKK
jgi:arylsulfatase A-like enzyme